MANRLGVFQNFGGGELRNWRFQNLATAPTTPVIGQPYFDTAKGGLYVWTGTAQRPADAALLTDGSIQNAALQTNPLARANHTGTQLANTISNLQTTVITYTLDTFAAPVGPLSVGNQRVTLAANASAATDLVPLAQMQSAISAAIQGVTAIKTPVRVVANSNITLSGLQTIDGVSIAAGDRVLPRAQTTGSQNVIYIAASGAWTVAPDSTNGELAEGTQVLCNEGTTYGGSIFRITTQGAITVGTTSITWTQAAQPGSYTADEATLHLSGSQFSARLGQGLTTVTAGIQVLPAPNFGLFVSASGLGITIPAAGGLIVDSTGLHIDRTSTIKTSQITSINFVGDGSTTSFTLTHNLNTRDIIVSFQDSSYAWTDIDWAATTVNTITVTFGTPAPANGTTYRATISS